MYAKLPETLSFPLYPQALNQMIFILVDNGWYVTNEWYVI